ncbi:MAG TPA: hypothetical protein VFB34_12175 [Chloroflexota bacterium]|nr:hypothetical protein [Chloroflexota bacterium]
MIERTVVQRLPAWEWLGIVCVIAGEALLATGWRPGVDFYFPVVWYGYILTLDGALFRMAGTSILRRSPLLFALMIPVSAACWWIFELFDAAVGSWRYIGAGPYSGAAFVVLATVSFSTVLLAVWETAMCASYGLQWLLTPAGRSPRLVTAVRRLTTYPAGWANHRQSDGARRERMLMIATFLLGLASILLPLRWPEYFFPLLWVALFFLLDPLNFWLGRPSILHQLWRGHRQTAASFALGALICGFFWESWNYWAPIKWVYSVPYVSQWHLFEMPVPGYGGYVPFGLELYAMAVFALWPLRRWGRLGREPFPMVDEERDEEPELGVRTPRARVSA